VWNGATLTDKISFSGLSDGMLVKALERRLIIIGQAVARQRLGKKESTGHRLNRPYPPCVRPSSNSSPGRNDARTAENGFATGSGVSKSAKVVLGSYDNLF
jgi:hypothetical protein